LPTAGYKCPKLFPEVWKNLDSRPALTYDGFSMAFIHDLTEYLKKEDFVYIQTHDFPDHDAVASAFALQKLLKTRKIPSYLVYAGKLQRDSLVRMIKLLDISIREAGKEPLRNFDKIIIVDGRKGSPKVTDLTGEEVAVIDHHQAPVPEDVRFIDIRDEYGSYYEDLGLEPVEEVATALIIGLLSATALMTKNVTEADIQAYNSLYDKSDIRLVNSILRNTIQKKDLSFYREAIDRVRIRDRLAFCYFPEGCNESLLGIIGEFFLSLAEVEFVLLCAKNNGKINFALRSEEDAWHAAKILKQILEDSGYGGGHSDMASGILNDPSVFDEETYYKKTLDLLKKAKAAET
jgi:nanoRNase/pAp phosphatase (c-di-AMP/oligoRNAs hydrolase)